MYCVAPILASREVANEYSALRVQRRPSLGYELSFDTSFAIVSRLGAEKKMRQTNKPTDRHYENSYIYSTTNDSNFKYKSFRTICIPT